MLPGIAKARPIQTGPASKRIHHREAANERVLHPAPGSALPFTLEPSEILDAAGGLPLRRSKSWPVFSNAQSGLRGEGQPSIRLGRSSSIRVALRSGPGTKTGRRCRPARRVFHFATGAQRGGPSMGCIGAGLVMESEVAQWMTNQW
jgi:hypothetical protein